MDGKIALSARERKICSRAWQRGPEVAVARRALVLLRLDAGASYRQICEACHVSSDFIAGLKRRYRSGGIDEALSGVGPQTAAPWWVIVILRWVQGMTPRAFGFFRSRWSCGVLSMLLWTEHGVRLHEETIRRQLRRHGYVWRRPRPIVGPVDPDYDRNCRESSDYWQHFPRTRRPCFRTKWM